MVEGATRLIILDTNALITFLENDQDSNEYNNLLRALSSLLGESIALPMPVVAEFIAGDQNDERTFDLVKPNSKFKKLDFDTKSALVAARVYKEYRALLKNNTPSQRPNQKVKIDIQIIGIALANGAKFIATRDKEIKRIIENLELPLTVLDFGDDSYYEQMTGKVLTESHTIQ